MHHIMTESPWLAYMHEIHVKDLSFGGSTLLLWLFSLLLYGFMVTLEKINGS